MIRLIQRKLIIPRGDTGTFSVPVLPTLNTGDVAVFTIFNPLTHTKVYQKIIEVNGDALVIRLEHSDTVNLPVNKYVWDIKFYQNPLFIDEELVSGDEVDSYYAAYSLPDCEIRETGDLLLTDDSAPTATLNPAQLDIISSALIEVHEAVEKTETNVEHYPTIIENVWYLWDADLREYVSTGVHANCISGGTTGQVYKKHSDADYDAEWGDETDPTVPAWAKAAQKPSYTAAEVGALPDDTFIPSNTSDLNNDSNFAVDANYVHTDNNYTTEEKNKLTGIAAGAEVNVNADWNAVSGDAQILNKPTNVSAFTNDAGYLTQHQDISGKLDSTLKGAANGLAELDAEGKVPSSQLPSYVDDILEYAAVSSFPATGETGKIYVAKDTNLTYRWGGSEYVEISASLALGETSSTAYRGDYGAAAYAHGVTNKGSAFASGLYKITTNSEGHVTAAAEVQKSDITALDIPAQDTTYESKSAVNGGTDVSLVTTGEKYGWNNKVDKSAIDDAGIQSRTYTTLFGGEFTVTTAQTSGYTNPRATYNVSSPSFSINKNYRVTINGTAVILPGKIWKEVIYANVEYTTYKYLGKIALRLPNITSLLNESNVTFCITCLSNALEISTASAGTYTILIEEVSETYTMLPSTLLYGSAMNVIESKAENTTYKISIPGPNNISQYGGYALGDCNTISGEYGIIFGSNNNVSGREGIAIGCYNVSSNNNAIAIGLKTTASGKYSCAIGFNNSATATHAFAEGGNNVASGEASHVEGMNNTASGKDTHVEGIYGTASGAFSHVEGARNTASGTASHAEGFQTIANHQAQHVFGLYNEADSSVAAASTKGNYVEIVGNGTADNARSNARTLDWDGNERLKGDLYVGANADGTGGTKVATISQIPTVPVTDVQINGSSILSSGVANIPIASDAIFGAVKTSAGISISNDGNLYLAAVTDANVKAGSSDSRAITPASQHKSTFYGLAKAAGDSTQSSSSNSVGTYTDSAKAAIQTMFGIDSLIAPTESSTMASQAYAINDLFLNDGKLYKATAAISQGAVLDSASNCQVTSIAAEMVRDVQIDGTSIINNGVANVPKAGLNSGYGVIKTGSGLGLGFSGAGNLMVVTANDAAIKNGTNSYTPITPYNQEKSIFYGLAKAAGDTSQSQSNNAVGTYTDSAKALIQHMLGTDTNLADYESDTTADAAYAIGELFMLNGKLHQATAAIAIGDTLTVGTNCAVVNAADVFPHDVKVNGSSVVANGVANIPMASDSNLGTIKVNSTYGIVINPNTGDISTNNSGTTLIKEGTNQFRPIAPYNQHVSTFYGLAKAAGDTTQSSSSNAVGTYTTQALAAIHTMLGIDPAAIAAQVDIPLVETVSGTTPSITGQPNTRYTCGEVATLSITPPASGTVDVIFESGSTATVLTVPNTVKFPVWFDATTLETNTTYEILITDGVYGSVMSWVT